MFLDAESSTKLFDLDNKRDLQTIFSLFLSKNFPANRYRLLRRSQHLTGEKEKERDDDSSWKIHFYCNNSYLSSFLAELLLG